MMVFKETTIYLDNDVQQISVSEDTNGGILLVQKEMSDKSTTTSYLTKEEAKELGEELISYSKKSNNSKKD